MAGSRQHFIPRFLKKGFSSKIQKTECYTWVFTKNSIPYETNLRNVGLENFFYGKPGESEVDEIITDREGYYSEQLDQLREINSDCELNGIFPAEFITHLIVRAKHLRESFKNAGASIVDIARKELDSPQKFNQMLSNIVLSKPDLIEQSLRQELDKRLPPDFPQDKKDMVVKHAMTLIPQIFSTSKINDGYALFSNLFTKMAEEMPNIAKVAHIKALSRGIVPPKIIEKFKDVEWSLTVTQKHNFILGDIGPIARFEPNLDFKPFLFANENIYQVFLPISGSQIIIGKSNKKISIPKFDDINKASVCLSQYYFISSKNGEKEKSLSNIISSKSSNISIDEINDAKQKIRKEWFGTSDN